MSNIFENIDIFPLKAEERKNIYLEDIEKMCKTHNLVWSGSFLPMNSEDNFKNSRLKMFFKCFKCFLKP